MKPLRNVTIIDLSKVFAGPFCSQQLSDLGARVIKVEPVVTGDDTRAWEPKRDGHASPFLAFNRNTRSLVPDLKTEEGREIVHRLVEKADVVIQSFKAATARAGTRAAKQGASVFVENSHEADMIRNIRNPLAGYCIFEYCIQNTVSWQEPEKRQGVTMTGTDFSLPEGTHTVAMGLGDANGIMRGKRFPASHWDNICKNGNAMSIATFAIDMTCDVWDMPYVNFDNGYPDMHMFPLTQPASIPWEPGVAMCMGRAEGMDHKPVPIDPRNVLAAQVERAASMGYEVNVGTEVEFYLLDPETKKPRDTGIGVYGLDRAAELEHVLGPIRREINEMGIPVEQSNPEYAAGQVEVNLRYADPLLAAAHASLATAAFVAVTHAYIYTYI